MLFRSVSMEALIESDIERRPSFELFKSNVCHRVKELGDVEFLIEALKKDEITAFFEKKWYPESLYLLAMVDYLSRVNNVPLCGRYNKIRKTKLKTILYPSGILCLSSVTDNKRIKEEAVKQSIPEFIRFNIVENEVRNVN